MRSPMVVRPMGAGELLDAAFSLTRRHYRPLIAVTAWGVVPMAVCSTAGALVGEDAVPVAAGFAIATLALWLLTCAALVVACGRIIDGDGPITPGAVFSTAAARSLPHLGYWVIVAALALPLIVLFPLGIYLVIRWMPAYASLFLEGSRPLAALRRSWRLTRRNWWHTFLVIFIATVIIGVVQVVAALVLGLLLGVTGFLLGGEATASILGNIAGSAANLLVSPPSFMYYVLLYYELRARNEGYDLTQRARQAASS